MLLGFTLKLKFELDPKQPRCLHCPLHDGYYDDIMQMWRYRCKLQNHEYSTMNTMVLRCQLVENFHKTPLAFKRYKQIKKD